MPVFISHRTTDNAIAKQVYDYLRQRGVPCYIDDLDPVLRNTDDITSTILQRLGQCTHLLAIISNATKESWWVPFEIGVGTVKDRRIASMKTSAYVTLPEYLDKWPIITAVSQLDAYIRLYRNDRQVLTEAAGGYETKEARSAFIQSASDFHRQMKSALSQR